MTRLLFIAHRMPFPPDKGERLRAFGQIKALAEHFRLTVVAWAHDRADYEAAAGLAEMCEQVIPVRLRRPAALVRAAWSLLTGRSATQGYFHSRRLVRAIAREPFDVAIGYCSGMLPALLAAPARARVLDLVDVDSAKWAAYARGARPPKRWLYAREADRVGRLEHEALRRCDAVLAVSEAEAAALGVKAGSVLAVGNGVDLDYFAATSPPSDPSVVFTGTMSYRPNVEGVCWFVRHVWSRVLEAIPQATFTIVGRDPTAAVRELASVSGVQVTGSVDDVRPYLEAAAVAVAPLRIARGVQNKVLEAMAAGRAVVASPEATEGLDVEAGREVVQAASAEQWACEIIDLLGNPDRAHALGAMAREAVERRYSWPARMRPLVDLCLGLAGRG